MKIYIGESTLNKPDPIQHAIAEKLDVPTYVIDVKQRCIIFRYYNNSILGHHFNTEEMARMIRTGHYYPFSFEISDNLWDIISYEYSKY